MISKKNLVLKGALTPMGSPTGEVLCHVTNFCSINLPPDKRTVNSTATLETIGVYLVSLIISTTQRNEGQTKEIFHIFQTCNQLFWPLDVPVL